MIYRVLITGNDTETIDSFFAEAGNKYTLMSTSERRMDIENHIGFFSPEIVMFCLNGESDETLRMISGLEGKFEKKKIKILVTGSEIDVDNFQKKTDRMAHIILKKPTNVVALDAKIQDYMAKKADKEDANKEVSGGINTKSQAVMNIADSMGVKIDDPTRKKLILAIDDEPLMLKVIQEQLKDKYDIAAATNGKLAYRYLEKKSPDVILLDYEMPGESGPEVMSNIRKIPQYADVPIIFLTGVTDMDKIKQVLQLKPQGYILKPLNREKLLDAISKVI